MNRPAFQFAKQKAKASLTVEACLIWPILLSILIILIQSALTLSMHSYLECLCQQAVQIFAETGAAEESVEEIRFKINQKLRALPVQMEKPLSVTVEDTIISREIKIDIEASYGLLIHQPIKIHVVRSARNAKKFRDLLSLAAETAQSIPEVKQWSDSYRRKLNLWAQKLK